MERRGFFARLLVGAVALVQSPRVLEALASVPDAARGPSFAGVSGSALDGWRVTAPPPINDFWAKGMSAALRAGRGGGKTARFADTLEIGGRQVIAPDTVIEVEMAP